MTAAQALRAARARLAHVDDPGGDARRLLAWAAGWDAAGLIARQSENLPPEVLERFDAAIGQRARHQPVAQITGRRLFMGLDLLVTPDVLDPRPESEVVVGAAMAALARRGWHDGRALRILDLGTGSGCLLLALLDALPGATGLGIDASEAALAVALANARTCGFEGRAEFQHGDWLRALDGAYDLVISNPPYIGIDEVPTLAPDVRLWEPKAALTDGHDGLGAYRDIAASLLNVLKSSAPAVFEIGVGQAATVKGIFAERGLVVEDITKDLDGRDRAVTVLETENALQ